MPSGSETSYDHCVVGGGDAVQLRILLPPALSCAERLHSFWLTGDGARFSMDHWKIGTCVKALKERRKTAAQDLDTIDHIRLPFKVVTNFEYEALRDADGALLMVLSPLTFSTWSSRPRRTCTAAPRSASHSGG